MYAVHTLLLCTYVFVCRMYMTMSVCMHLYMHMYVDGWKPEVSVGCHLSSISTSLSGDKVSY